MGRIFLGIIVGFLVWSVIWIGSAGVLTLIWADFAESMTTMKFTFVMLMIALLRSFIASILSGLVAVLVSKEFSKTTIALGVVLLLFGLYVQISSWSLMPLWYHLVFLALLIPMTILGGKLKKREPLA